MTVPKIEVGQVHVSPAAAAALALNPANDPDHRRWLDLLERHASGDWGNLDHEDARANHRALIAGGRIQSAYTLPGGDPIWIATSANRTATTIIRPTEYR